MTNQELYAEIKDLRNDMNKGFREVRDDQKVIHKDFYVFKGKAFGFMTALIGILEIAKHFVLGR